MKIQIRIVMGATQGVKFTPELLKICNDKKVTLDNRKFKRINFAQGELTGILSGENANYVYGWIEGYGKAVELNKPEPKKLAPAK